MMDPKFCGEIKIVFVDDNGKETPLTQADTVEFASEEPKEEKSFLQSIADILTKYEQILIDWDTKKISEEEMINQVEEFELKVRPMMLDMLYEFKTVNNVLGYLRTMISAARIASMYGVEVSDDLKDIIDEVDFLRNKIKFSKEEPVIGRSAGVDEIEKFVSSDEDIEILELEENETKKECSNCQGCNCKNNDLKEMIELIDLFKKFL